MWQAKATQLLIPYSISLVTIIETLTDITYTDDRLNYQKSGWLFECAKIINHTSYIINHKSV